MSKLVNDPWCLIESAWNPESVRASESLFSIGNGRFGQRANFEEHYSGDSHQGSYLAGIYYPDKTRVGWWKNGYPDYFAKVLNATNWISIDVHVNGERLDLHAAREVRHFSRLLDMRDGILKRTFEVELQNGAVIAVEAQRFCSMHRPETAVIRYAVTAISGSMEVELCPAIDGDVKNEDSNWDDAFWKTLSVESNSAGSAGVLNQTEKTAFESAAAMRTSVHKLHSGGADAISASSGTSSAHAGFCSFQVALENDETVVLEKFVGITTSLHHAHGQVLDAAKAVAASAFLATHAVLLDEQQKAWQSIWSRGDIVIDGDVSAQQAIRFNVFHLNQTYRGDDPRLNIGPKGFTGEKYGGASYWDTEAYCLPFFLAGHEAAVPKQLLLYRYHHLGRAIENAEKLGFSCGAALYPMVTMNGEECHNEWEITFEEIHRNGAMVYAIWNYINYTGDQTYMADHGFAVVLGVARFWAQRVQWSEPKQAYVILGVTGPNEYENNVNNNWYTNYLAAWCLHYAASTAEALMKNQPQEWDRLVNAYDVNAAGEIARWKTVSSAMFQPQLENTRVLLQQDGFMDKEQLQASDLPSSQRPINQHWSWDRILRSVFIKQADVLQGFYFFQDDFDQETLEENYAFYEPKTVHESSLSPCVHAILAAKLGRKDEAYVHYLRTARLDLDDYNKEVYQGLHITSMAGTWLSVVEGFGGFRVRDGIPEFKGVLPEAWRSLQFLVHFRGRQLEIRIEPAGTLVTLLHGDPLQVKVDGELRSLQPAA
ncbi:MAG: family 65 glycosyl hydrolase domain-containing protein [Bacteroidetes bacterium]|nr:family 65 glycosyl hydrolase domain-containing protein [Bacteroidota bacterium]